ncbi:MAG: hypothetical protein E5W06_00325 [Mesorhizobium sp.]|nr:MAG: hypothetical protein E5W06_00325 [Mesorhizobium sp.]
MTSALINDPSDFIQAFLSNHEPRESWFRNLLLPAARRQDYICLRLPWGKIQTFGVPARDPQNPKFQFRPREHLKHEPFPEMSVERVARYKTTWVIADD